MRIHGKVLKIDDMLSYAKRGNHYCTKCNGLLNIVKTSHVAKKHSHEVKEFWGNDSFSNLAGNIELIYWEFCCPNCGERISFEEMQKIERNALMDAPKTASDMMEIESRKKRLRLIKFLTLFFVIFLVIIFALLIK